VIRNKDLKVVQGQSTVLTRGEFDVKDDDTAFKLLEFQIVAMPKYGRIENIIDPGKIFYKSYQKFNFRLTSVIVSKHKAS
jgi:hypothetical protein